MKYHGKGNYWNPETNKSICSFGIREVADLTAEQVAAIRKYHPEAVIECLEAEPEIEPEPMPETEPEPVKKKRGRPRKNGSDTIPAG